MRYQLEALPGQGIRPHALGFPHLFLCHLMGQATPIVEKNPSDHTCWAHSYSSPHSTNVQEQLVLRVTWGLEGTVGFHGAETNTQPTLAVGVRVSLLPLWPPAWAPSESLPCFFHSGAQHLSHPDLPMCDLAMHTPVSTPDGPHARGLKALFLHLVLVARAPKPSEFTPGAHLAAPNPSAWVPRAWGRRVLRLEVVRQGVGSTPEPDPRGPWDLPLWKHHQVPSLTLWQSFPSQLEAEGAAPMVPRHLSRASVQVSSEAIA